MVWKPPHAGERGNLVVAHPWKWLHLSSHAVDGELAMGVVRHGEALPLPPRIAHLEDEVQDAMRAHFALWTTLRH